MRSLFFVFTVHWILHLGLLLQAGAQSCPSPLIFTGNEISDTSIILRWFSIDLPEVGYQLNVQGRGNPPSDSTSFFLASPNERDTIFSLQPQTAYTAFIRSICDTDTSDWKSFEFHTALRNGMACRLNIELSDNSCIRGGQDIPVFVKDLPSDTLGVNINLQSIQLIIDHPYPADLKLSIRNPSGQSIRLIEHHGSFTDNFGDPLDTNCTQVAEFTTSACRSIYASPPPFIGQHLPEDDISTLNDGTSANGKWSLHVCDRAPDDIGYLKHIQFNFTQNICPEPPSIYPNQLGDSTQVVLYESVQADSLRLLYGVDSTPPAHAQDTGYIGINADPTDSTIMLSGLELGTTYYTWSFIYCDGRWTGPSCRKDFTTLNRPIQLYSDWEEENICNAYCNAACPLLDEVWQNSGFAWNIQRGPTPTDQTGPERDVFFNGQYLFKESSQTDCREGESILQSICLNKSDSISGIAFYYQMNGNDVGDLILLISQNEWQSSDTIWAIHGDLDEDWLFENIELPDSIMGAFQLRFTAGSSTSAFGDIALGDIALYGISPLPLMEQLYFTDRDGDGYGNIDSAIFYCGKNIPDSLSSIVGDCDDMNATIHPNARDTVCNGIDEDCNGVDNLGGADPLIITVDSLLRPSCPGISDGFISVEVSGGVPPYSIQWSTGANGSYVDSLPSGTYSVQVEDNNSCQNVSRNIQLLTSNPVSFSFQIIERPSCPFPDYGKVEVILSGGTPPYEIVWSNGERGDLADSLPTGNFYVTVIDSMNCTYRSQDQLITSEQAYPLDIIEVKSISCPGDSNGSLRVLAPGSLPPLDIQWSTADTSRTITGLASGYYSVSVSDANGCSLSTDSFFLAAPLPLLLSELLIDPQRCAGEPSASVSAEVVGGTPPYAFRWLTPDSNILTGANLSGIASGLYELTVSDSKGCSYTMDSILVKAQDPILLDSLRIESTTCQLSRDGSIHFTIDGGNPPYRISWSDGITQTSSRNSLSSGLYSLTISDDLDCKFTFPELRVPKGNEKLELELEIIDSLFCIGNDSASIRASILDGKSPYFYNWSVGEQHTSSYPSDTLNGLSAGYYQLTVTDGIGCVGSSEPIRIDSLSAIRIESIQQRNIDCPGDMNGQLKITASSPSGELEYYWSNGESGPELDSLPPGPYQVTITDGSKCIPKVIDFIIEARDSLDVMIDSFVNEGNICFSVDSITGGTPPYSYFWEYGDTISRSNIFCIPYASETDLYLELIDDRWCDYSFLVFEASSHIQHNYQEYITVFPNPFSEFLIIANESRSLLKVSVRDLSGKSIYHGNLRQAASLEIFLPQVPPGMYFLVLELKNGKVYTQKLIRQ